jgi:hypothetical protein
MKRTVLVVTLLMINIFHCYAQETEQGFIKDILIKTDSLAVNISSNKVSIDNDSYLYFNITDLTSVQEIIVRPNPSFPASFISILGSSDYTIIDSTKLISGEYHTRVRFNNLDVNNKIKLNVLIKEPSNVLEKQYKLIAVSKPSPETYLRNIDLFQDEQKIIEIPVKNGFNIKADNATVQTKDFDYSLSYKFNILFLRIKAHSTGLKHFSIPLKTVTPFVDDAQHLTNDLPPLLFNFNITTLKLNYLNFDKSTIYFNQDYKNSEQILIDYNPIFEMSKNYRIEDQNSGGILIAELYTLSPIDNKSKIICRIRPYSFHKITDGYLYIKDGDKNRSICNLNIIEKPQINRILIRRDGEDWEENLKVHPNENLEIKLQGKGLKNCKIQFDNITELKLDSAKSSDETVFYHLKIPIKIALKKIPIFIDRKETDYELIVEESKKPVNLEFVSINYGQQDIPITKINKPVLYDNVIKDININFNPDKIDENNQLFGKQYLTIEVKIFNKEDDLIETEKIDDIIICPGDKSPRRDYYNLSDCTKDPINLNDYLDHKTYKLPAFTQILITIKDDMSKYNDDKGYTRKIRLILERKYNFDLQLSFPTGLVVKKYNEPGLGSLTGISASVLFNLKFYDKSEIGKLHPYSIGAGFLVLDALNLNNSASNPTDLGLVVMGSISPFKKNAKFSVPIYLGGGYFVKQGVWFAILGPGLEFNF